MTDYRSTMKKDIETYQYNEKYFIDVFDNGEYYESWVYHYGYGVKMLMFATDTSQLTKDEFLNLTFDRADEYIELYHDEYEN